VLFKPENFDSTKQYPIIIYYYELKSDGLNAYLKPEPLSGGCNINIPSYVSRGYVVLTPDIHYTIGEPGESALNAVVSAADYLATLPWVDGRRMGIEGCSMGGFETNYIVTHTSRFAAAVSASGLSDLISGFGSLADDGSSWEGAFELGQPRLGASLWESPERYIKNSPIFGADKLTTPLLMMHTKQDASPAAFLHAVEFFTGLRRLGKKVWMLQYDDGNHAVWGRSADDFSIRMVQFFDHYLRGAPPPAWMTRGVPAKLKGVDTGLELDTSGKEP
jgi:dipeptidyl aminopeptidase/acylaminoacyl peptidase